MNLFSKKSENNNDVDINSVNNTVGLLREEILRVVSDLTKVKNEVSEVKLKNFVSNPKNGDTNMVSQLNFMDQKISSINNNLKDLNNFKADLSKDLLDQKRVEKETNMLAESNNLSISTMSDFVEAIDNKLKILDTHIQNDENISKSVKKNMANLIKKEDDRLALILKKLKSIALKSNKEELEFEAVREDLKEISSLQKRIENVSNVIDILGDSISSKIKKHHNRMNYLESSNKLIEDRLNDTSEQDILKSKISNFSLVIEMLSDSINKHFDDSDKRIEALESFKKDIYSQLKSDFDITPVKEKVKNNSIIIDTLSSSVDSQVKSINEKIDLFKKDLYSQIKSDFDMSLIENKVKDNTLVIETLSSAISSHFDSVEKKVDDFKKNISDQLKSDFDIISTKSKVENNALMLEVLSSSVNSHFGDVDKKIEDFDVKIKEEFEDIKELNKKVDSNKSSIESVSSNVDEHFDTMDDRLDKIEAKISSSVDRIDELSDKMEKLAKILVLLSSNVSV